MQLRTYQNESDFVADYSAYNAGDLQAGNRIAREIKASGTTIAELASAFTQYQRNAANPLARVYAESTEASVEDWHNAGVMLDRDAKEIQRAKNCTYSEALAESRDRNPTSVMIYDRRRRPPAPDGETLKQVASRFADDTSQSPITVVANLVTGLPRLASNEINWEVATMAVNNLIDALIRTRAADEFLAGLAAKSSDKTRGDIDDEHESLAAVVITGEYDEDALMDLLNQFVR